MLTYLLDSLQSAFRNSLVRVSVPSFATMADAEGKYTVYEVRVDIPKGSMSVRLAGKFFALGFWYNFSVCSVIGGTATSLSCIMTWLPALVLAGSLRFLPAIYLPSLRCSWKIVARVSRSTWSS